MPCCLFSPKTKNTIDSEGLLKLQLTPEKCFFSDQIRPIRFKKAYEISTKV